MDKSNDMIDPRKFTEVLIKNNLGPIVEVPCSYLKDFFNYLWAAKSIEIINPVNESLAMGIASGYYLSTGKIPIVAIQNSGFTNTINALTSLNQIYDIPVFYLLTWRGEGGVGFDAPEHDVTGGNMEKILQTLELPYEIIDVKKYPTQIKKLANLASKTQKPVALVIRKNTFQEYAPTSRVKNISITTRYEAIKIIKYTLTNGSVFISSTGYPSRDSHDAKDTPDFYMVGSMGHAFSLALGIAPNTNKKVVVFDGDGAALMHLGGLSSFDPKKHKNLIYIVLDNENYESTGGQPTLSPRVDFKYLAKAFQFKNMYSVTKKSQLKNILKKLKPKESSFIHIKINNSDNEESKRVSDYYTCQQIKKRFMKNINSKNRP